MKRRAMKTGDEVDAFTGWRHMFFWKPGERKAIKTRANRRERREARDDIREDQE